MNKYVVLNNLKLGIETFSKALRNNLVTDLMMNHFFSRFRNFMRVERQVSLFLCRFFLFFLILSMREQMVLDEKIVGVELSASKKQFKWPVNDTEKKAKDSEDDDNESSDEMSALQKIFVVHSVRSLSYSIIPSLESVFSLQAVLGVGAKADQRNLVHLTIKDTSGDKVILDQPILSLSVNKNDSVGEYVCRNAIYL